MPACDGANGGSARQTLSDDLRLVFGAPGPPAARPSENLNPPNRLRASAMLSHLSKSNDEISSQTLKSRALPKGGARRSLTREGNRPATNTSQIDNASEHMTKRNAGRLAPFYGLN